MNRVLKAIEDVVTGRNAIFLHYFTLSPTTAGFYVYRMCPFELNILADPAWKGL